MARAPRTAAPGCIHHVTTRGPTELAPFPDGYARDQLLGSLGKVAGDHGWVALAYSVLTTHYHLLVFVPDESLSLGMHAVHTRYARWLNRREGRRGRVWADRFGSRPVRSEQHLANAIVYVDLNAAEAGLAAAVGDWRWDSASANAGLAPPRPWHDPERARQAVLGEGPSSGDDYGAILRARLSLGGQAPESLSPESLSPGGQAYSRRRL